MEDGKVLYEVEARVATITLNRPATLNALGSGMREALFGLLHRAADDPAVGVVVITGAGEAFCAGGDIADMAALQAQDDAAPIAARVALAGEIVTYLRSIAKPVIAAVNGAAAGGGMNLALACDFRYGSSRARFAQSFVKIGLVPDWGGHYFLTRLVGTARAMELMMSGERIDADQAHRLGLLNEVLPAEGFLEQALLRARRLASGPAAALAAIKRGVYLGAEASLETVLAYEGTVQPRLFLEADAREGMRAFLAKRAPQFGQA